MLSNMWKHGKMKNISWCCQLFSIEKQYVAGNCRVTEGQLTWENKEWNSTNESQLDNHRMGHDDTCIYRDNSTMHTDEDFYESTIEK